LDNSLGDFGFQAIPRKYPAVIFTVSEAGFWEIGIDGRKYKLGNTNVYFTGLGFVPSEMYFKGAFKAWVLMLKPQASSMIFGDAAKSFVNELYCVTDTHPQLRFLSEQLQESSFEPEKAVMLIESFFIRFLDSQRIKPNILLALHEIHHSNGNLNVKELAYISNTCTRNLLRQFDDYVGVNPKTYSAMIRFSGFMNQVMCIAPTNMEKLAFDFGYYDLSHLNKDALRFLGMPVYEMKHQKETLNHHMV
jgi:AraC-like DNA-binding protein